MSVPPPTTRFDLQLRLFGTAIRLHPMFWLVAVLLGLRLPPAEHLVFVIVVFVSVLGHEMGHVFSSRAIGLDPHVVLHSLGGSTRPQAESRLAGWQDGLVMLAGPLASGMLALAAFALLPLLGAQGTGLLGALRFHLVSVNVTWALLNLLPVQPLDGGRASQRVLVWVGGETGYAIASILSLVTAGLVAVVSWRMSQPLLAVFVGYLALKEWQRPF